MASEDFDSCIFDLVDLLKLLPGQTRSRFLQTEPVTLEEWYTDNETYYCRSSLDGILRLLAQYFVGVQESASQLRVQTSLGSFDQHVFTSQDQPQRTSLGYQGA